MIFLINFTNISMRLYMLLISLITGVNMMDIEEIIESEQVYQLYIFIRILNTYTYTPIHA